GDRFIPLRYRPENIELNANYIHENEDMDLLQADLTQQSSYWRQNSFVREMNNTFGIRSARLLQFNQMQSHLAGRFNPDKDWPCMPRPRPMAFPNATHEMPELCTSFDLNLMDWSITGQMAVSFGEDVIIWHNRDETTMVFSVKHPRALKYSPDGKFLAIGCMDSGFPVLELWKLQHAKDFLVSDGKYFRRSVQSVCCIAWSNDSREIVCGMENGLLMVLGMPSVCKLHRIQKHKNKITCIRFSANDLYMASADMKGNVIVFSLMQYRVMHRLLAKAGNVILDWHPWTGVDLAICEKYPPSICIFNVPREDIVAYYQRFDKKILINSISFNRLTGELLVNIYKPEDGDDNSCCEILVLASFNRIVDILGNRERGSVFMMWSPDGTKLATAGLDESFSVWEFFSKHHLESKVRKIKSKCPEKRSELELYRLFK
ncbi:hypothetical protein KR222_002516, partial [Zaprionus bogoriensis]